MRKRGVNIKVYDSDQKGRNLIAIGSRLLRLGMVECGMMPCLKAYEELVGIKIPIREPVKSW